MCWQSPIIVRRSALSRQAARGLRDLAGRVGRRQCGGSAARVRRLRCASAIRAAARRLKVPGALTRFHPSARVPAGGAARSSTAGTN